MEALLQLVSGNSTEFSSDLADWLSPPQKPVRPVSKRHRIAIRNSVAFCIVWILIFSAGYFALAGTLPGLPIFAIVTLFAATFGLVNWRKEYGLATKEDRVLLQAHWERYRAFLHRKRVWARLFYCRKCALVIDPVTRQAASLYDVHELANTKVKDPQPQ